VGNSISAVHILPFFPYSSDDGFSVVDYTQVDPDLGSWSDILALGERYRLMFDFVLNHISRHSDWFQKFLAHESPYEDFFIVVDPHADLSSVVRPRALPLITQVATSTTPIYVWTTFSEDQIDLNFANPEVAIRMLNILLDYVVKNAEIIRLDAIAYLWKEIGSPCIHLPKTHHFVKLMRAVLDAVAPGVTLITETNVPHEENVSYFGEPISLQLAGEEITRSDEAQMVYQFSLAPLVLHTFLAQNSNRLTQWAANLRTPFPEALFFNFIASHDGFGVRPAEGILSVDEVQGLVDRTIAHRGQVSYRNNPDGSKSPYELNITLFDFLNNPAEPNPNVDMARFLASQAIMLSLAGVPGIYVHSFFGSSNCDPCVAETGRARSINREKFIWSDIKSQLDDSQSRASKVLSRLREMLEIRQATPALNPSIRQQVLQIDPNFFLLLRGEQGTNQILLVCINISDQPIHLDLDLHSLDLEKYSQWQDLFSGMIFPKFREVLHLEIAPYQYLWLVPPTKNQ
jgi:sucrose phosphorylase